MPRLHQLDGFLGYHLRRASSLLMTDLAERLSTLGLRTAEASVMVVLDADPLIAQSEIGRRLAIKRANMAPLIAGLVARDLVARTEPVGRTQPLRLTAKGRKLAADARSHMDAHDREFFGALDPAEQERLRRLLAALWRDDADIRRTGGVQPDIA